MADPYIKAIPDEDTGLLHFVMDRTGYEIFERLIDRSEPRRADNPGNFRQFKDRIKGAFMAGGVVMKWGQR